MTASGDDDGSKIVEENRSLRKEVDTLRVCI